MQRTALFLPGHRPAPSRAAAALALLAMLLLASALGGAALTWLLLGAG